MVISGRVNRVAFYCRVNHRDRDYEKYLDDVMKRLEEKYGKQEWDLQIFFEEASGADPDRKEFNRLKMEIAAKKMKKAIPAEMIQMEIKPEKLKTSGNLEVCVE